jgi:hypothetical protein
MNQLGNRIKNITEITKWKCIENKKRAIQYDKKYKMMLKTKNLKLQREFNNDGNRKSKGL